MEKVLPLLFTSNKRLIHTEKTQWSLCKRPVSSPFRIYLSGKTALTKSAQSRWCNSSRRGFFPAPVTLTGLSACYFGHAERSVPLLLSSSPPLLLFSPGSAALELGTRDVHCLSAPLLRGEARCEGEISREETAESRGRVSPGPGPNLKVSRFPLISSLPPPFLSFFPSSRSHGDFLAGSTGFHRVASQPLGNVLLSHDGNDRSHKSH